MPSASVIISPLECKKCGKTLIVDGELKCLRCKRKVPATLGQKKIFCPHCRKPKMLLAKNGQALCPRKGCRDIETPMFKKEEIEMAKKETKRAVTYFECEKKRQEEESKRKAEKGSKENLLKQIRESYSLLAKTFRPSESLYLGKIEKQLFDAPIRILQSEADSLFGKGIIYDLLKRPFVESAPAGPERVMARTTITPKYEEFRCLVMLIHKFIMEYDPDVDKGITIAQFMERVRISEDKVIDIFKEGEGIEKLVYLEIDGKRVGTIHLGSEGAPGDPSRVIININPALHRSNYKVGKIEGMQGGTGCLIVLDKAMESGVELS